MSNDTRVLLPVLVVIIVVVIALVSVSSNVKSSPSTNKLVYTPQKIDSETVKAKYLLRLMKSYKTFPNDAEMAQLRKITEEAWPKDHYYVILIKSDSYNYDGFVYLDKIEEQWVFDLAEDKGYYVKGETKVKTTPQKASKKDPW